MQSTTYVDLVAAYLGEGRHMEAMVVAKKAVQAHPDEPAVSLLLANVYVAMKKRRRAAEVLEGILARWTNYHPARELLEKLPAIFGES